MPNSNAVRTLAKTPVVLMLSKGPTGYHFSFHGKCFSHYAGGLETNNLEEALMLIRTNAERFNLEIAERMPVLDHETEAISISSGKGPPKITSCGFNSLIQTRVKDYSDALALAWDKLEY